MTGLRLAIVGAGNIAGAYVDVLAGVPDVEVVAVADVDREAADRLASRFGCRSFTSHQALGDTVAPDAVVICTPPVTHADIACWFVERGVHVLSEKPLTTDLPSARSVLAAARRHGVVLTMASKFRFDADIIDARRRVAAGEIGDVVLVANAFTSRLDMRGRWQSDPAVAGGGVVMDNGTHSVDIVRYLLGPIREVMAVDVRRVQGLAVEDTAMLVTRSVDGVMATVDLSWSIDKSLEDLLTVYGTAGEIRVGFRRTELRHAGGDWTRIGDGYRKIPAMRGALANFVDAVLHGAALVATEADAIASVGVIEAAYRSMGRTAWEPVQTRMVERALA